MSGSAAEVDLITNDAKSGGSGQGGKNKEEADIIFPLTSSSQIRRCLAFGVSHHPVPVSENPSLGAAAGIR